MSAVQMTFLQGPSGAGDGEGELGDVVGAGLTLQDWLIAGAILMVGFALAMVLRSVASRLIARTDAEQSAADFVGKATRNLIALTGLIIALAYLDVRITPLLGALGIGGLAVAFAAQSILENTFASVLLRTRRPFRRGDQISTNDFDGTVEDVNFRTVVLRTYDGEKVLVPCGLVLGSAIVNHTVNGSRRTTLEVGVEYDSDLDEARETLLDAAAGIEGVLTMPPPEAWVHEFGDNSINIALRFWHAPDIATTWRVRSGVAVAAKSAFDEAGIEIPFPQRVLTFVNDRADGDHDSGGPDSLGDSAQPSSR